MTDRFLPLAALIMLGAGPALAAEPPTAALKGLSVYPPKIELKGPRAEQRVGVLGEYADGRSWELTGSARFASSNADVASVDGTGRVRGRKAGQATLNIEAGGLKASVAVRVEAVNDEAPVDFSREVTPLLTRFGCNAGACHGAQHGRGGFRLSLFGFDPVFDHPQIVQSAEGRRVVLSDPERSVLLLKPALALEHGGGERFKSGSREYELLRRWLEDGAPAPTPKDPGDRAGGLAAAARHGARRETTDPGAGHLGRRPRRRRHRHRPVRRPQRQCRRRQP
jgi:hypothetical protein